MAFAEGCPPGQTEKLNKRGADDNELNIGEHVPLLC